VSVSELPVKRIVLAVTLLACLICVKLVGCQEEEPGARVATVPVKGLVLVDGKPPGSPIAVRCIPVNGVNEENPTVTSTFTKDDGTFELGTYEASDGIPAGEYIVTFQWGTMNVMSRQYSGDKFEGSYKDPEKSEFRITITDEPTELPTFELKLPDDS
jgi:hypothetical protein